MLGLILLNIDDQNIPEAQTWIEKAIDADKRNGMLFRLGDDYTAYAELFERKGDISRVSEALGKARDLYPDCGAEGWAEICEKKLAELS